VVIKVIAKYICICIFGNHFNYTNLKNLIMIKLENIDLWPLKINGQYHKIAQKIVYDLRKVKRTGWVDRGVREPETVYEHTETLIILADKYFSDIAGLTRMLKIHDWAESDKKVGDRRTDKFCPIETRWNKEQKFEVELAAMQNICQKLEIYGDEIMNLWLEYEKRETERARIAYELDKFQAIIKAIEYQKAGEPVKASEFIGADGPKIKHGILRRILREKMAEISL